MRVLAIGTALSEGFVALVDGDEILASERIAGGRGMVDLLGRAIRAVSDEGVLAAVAALVGPGSFTGIRAGLAAAHGIGLARSCPVVGVTVGEAVRAGLGVDGPLWVVTDAKRGTVFLEGDGPTRSVRLDTIERPAAVPLLAGEMAEALAAQLADRGMAAAITSRPVPGPLDLVRAARARMEGELPPLPPLPLYVDGPQTSVSGFAARPAPA